MFGVYTKHATMLMLILGISACSTQDNKNKITRPKITDASIDMPDAGTVDIAKDLPPADMPEVGDMADMPADMDQPIVTGLIEDPGHESDTEAQLKAFYTTYGGRDAFPASHVRALEALLYAEDDLRTNNTAGANARVGNVFAQQPRSDLSWQLAANGGTGGSNTGHPVGYYGLRMVETIHKFQNQIEPSSKKLVMTGVIAKCTNARVPQPAGMDPTNERVDLHPGVLENKARRLFLATGLFRQWVHTITRGRTLELRIYVLEQCANTDFTDNGSTIVSYPNTQQMVDAVPTDISNSTDIWWVISPSGVRKTETELGRHSITGGMGLSSDGRPLVISDDLWFIRKPDHMGRGAWTEVELRTYHPQWFQHEFMHHLFRTWPQFGLEVTSHQWFDRNTWPDDFEGRFEPDYYSEAIAKRLFTATPTLGDGLKAPEYADADSFELTDFTGQYERDPVENDWHKVTITVTDNALTWTNAANASWSMVVDGAVLKSGADCPYGEMPVPIETKDGKILSLVFNGEKYKRVD